MKKFLTMAAMAALVLLGVSCNKEVAPNQGGEIQVTIAVAGPDGMLTKAFSDGKSATKLQWAIFDPNGTQVDGSNLTGKAPAVATAAKTFTLSTTLLAGTTYKFVFWADSFGGATGTPYTVDLATQALTVDYTKVTAGSDDFDAFYAVESEEATPTMTFTLARPFAQVNVGTTDLAQAVGLGFHKAAAEVTFTGKAYTAMNLADATVSGLADVNLALTGLPEGETFPSGIAANYVTMAYLLMPKSDNELVNCNIAIDDKANHATSIPVANVPFKANFRTNIYGALLTNPTEITVKIEEKFEDDKNGVDSNDVEVVDKRWNGTTLKAVTPVQKTIDGTTYDVYSVSLASELAYLAANNNLGGTDTYIRLTDDVDLNGKDFTPFGNVSRSASGFTGVFDGNGKTVKGLKATATADKFGVGLFAVVDDATIKNVNIDGAELSSADFAASIVGCALGDVTIDNCHVTNSTISGEKIGGFIGRAYGTNHVVMNCTTDNETVIAATATAGGIIGIHSFNNGIVRNCTNNAKVCAVDAGSGGIIGYLGAPNCIIDGCVNNGEVGVTASKYTGGICGYVNGSPEDFQINSCSNKGKVIGQIVGGILGITGSYGYVSISDCTNSGLVEATEQGGGIAGSSGGSKARPAQYARNVNTGCVTAPSAGGVFGKIQYAEVVKCSGGAASAVITSANGTAGRIAGTVSNGPDEGRGAVLTIDDSNGDDYSTLPSIALSAPGTAWGVTTVIAGTLHGVPACGGNTGRITIEAGAEWDEHPGETGTWQGTAGTSTWTKH